MKRTAVITAVAVASMLLVGCQSERDRKTEICAQWAATDKETINFVDGVIETWKKLGIKDKGPGDTGIPIDGESIMNASQRIVWDCDFYKG